MSSESTSKDKNGEWVMPEPIFRSSEGRTPGAKSEADTDEMETETPATVEVQTDDELADVFDETAMNHVRAAPAKPVVEAKSGGCFQNALMTFLMVSIVAIGIVAAAIYYFFYSGSSGNGTFN